MKLDEEAKKYGDVEASGWVKTTALDVMTLSGALLLLHLAKQRNSVVDDSWCSSSRRSSSSS
jgi:hypothetical protein